MKNIYKCINLFNLLPTSQPHIWLIAADWLEEENKELEANAFRESIFNLEIINATTNANTTANSFSTFGWGDNMVCGWGDDTGCGWGDDNHGSGWGNGYGRGYGDGYSGGWGWGNGFGDGCGGGTGNNTGVA